MRHDHAELGNARRCQIDAVETIGEIDLEQVDAAFGGIGKEDAAKEAIKCPAELHGVHGDIRLGGGVDAVESIIDDRAWAACVLGDDADRMKAKATDIADRVVLDDYPELLVHIVGHVFAKESLILIGGLVGSACDTGGEFFGGPRGVGEGDRHAMTLIVAKEAMCGMGAGHTERAKVSCSGT